MKCTSYVIGKQWFHDIRNTYWGFTKCENLITHKPRVITACSQLSKPSNFHEFNANFVVDNLQWTGCKFTTNVAWFSFEAANKI